MNVRQWIPWLFSFLSRRLSLCNIAGAICVKDAQHALIFLCLAMLVSADSLRGQQVQNGRTLYVIKNYDTLGGPYLERSNLSYDQVFVWADWSNSWHWVTDAWYLSETQPRDVG